MIRSGQVRQSVLICVGRQTEQGMRFILLAQEVSHVIVHLNELDMTWSFPRILKSADLT